MSRLPIYDVIPQLKSLLRDHPAIIVQAPPGAGKTTVVPLELLDLFQNSSQKMVMLEPRRLAASNAARWMATSLGEEVGETVGYTIRFESRTSSATRIEVVTEGILTRRLQGDPFLEGIAVVIFDEFHERSINSDTALAFCRDVQKGLRPDLKIVIMSATLEGERLSRLLDGAPIVTSEGRMHPVGVIHLPEMRERRLADAAARAVHTALVETDGDILVFLPGVGEIRECERILNDSPHLDILVLPLYGDLPFAAQERVLLPQERRKVVLATNIAETSLTIEGVKAVVDAGFARQLRYDPVTGMNRLVTVRISAASAAQRCGRAGRTGPGVCYRLWDEHTQRGLVPHSPPEVLVSDLAPLTLDLALWGVADPQSLAWLDPLPESALAEGRKLLRTLGALDAGSFVTTLGKEMANLPVHPRLALMLVEGRRRGLGALACDIASLLGERDMLRSLQPSSISVSSSDLVDRLDMLAAWRRGAGSDVLDKNACRTVDRTSQQFRRLLRVGSGDGAITPEPVGLLLALAYPDRLAQQREPGSDRYLLANGRGCRLSTRSAVRNAPFIVAAAVDAGEGGEGVIHLASALEVSFVRKEFPHLVTKERQVSWDRQMGKPVAREVEKLDALLLSSRPVPAELDEGVQALLDEMSRSGIGMLNWSENAEQFRLRVQFLRWVCGEEWPDLSDESLSRTAASWLRPWVTSSKVLENIHRIDLLACLQSLLTWEQRQRLIEGAPTHLRVPSGSLIPLSYSPEGSPVLAVKLQELFGLAETPTVAWGRVPVLLHLLSPARRPLQVTDDLKSFWNSTYQDIKKELKGRYPKHPWPDDPWTAVPTRHTVKRMKSV